MIKIKEFLKNRPTLVDKNCFTLTKNILLYYGWKKNFKLTNVTPGLASLLGREGLSIQYNEIDRICYINPSVKEENFIEFSCDEKELSKAYCEIKRKLGM